MVYRNGSAALALLAAVSAQPAAASPGTDIEACDKIYDSFMQAVSAATFKNDPRKSMAAFSSDPANHSLAPALQAYSLRFVYDELNGWASLAAPTSPCLVNPKGKIDAIRDMDTFLRRDGVVLNFTH